MYIHYSAHPGISASREQETLCKICMLLITNIKIIYFTKKQLLYYWADYLTLTECSKVVCRVRRKLKISNKTVTLSITKTI